MKNIVGLGLVLGGFLIATSGLATVTPTFRDSYSRYISGHDLFRLLNQKFPHANWANISRCGSLDPINGPALGIQNPANGQLTYPGPSGTFTKWYLKCLLAGIDAEMAADLLNPSDLDVFFGAAALKTFPSAAQAMASKWSTVPVEVQRVIAIHLIHGYIGPNIVRDENSLAQRMINATSTTDLITSDAIKKLVGWAASQDEFLSY
jgi:hypothetical protein